jgi:tape measure domain-containing protein
MSQVVVEIGADAAAFQRTVNGLPQSVQRVSGQMSAAFAGIGFLALAKQALDTVTSMDRLRRGMTTLEGSAQGAEQRLRELQEAAQLPGVDFEQAVKADIKLRSVGMTAEMSKGAIVEMGNALSLAGGTSADLEGVVLALTQIISKGKVSAEEINQIAERVPQVRAVMKDVFGTADTDALQKMKIGAEDFVSAIIGGFSNLDRATAGLDEKLSDFRTSIMIATDALMSGLVGESVDGMSQLGKSITDNIDLIREMGAALRDAGSIAADVATGIAETFRGVYAVGKMGGRLMAGQSLEDARAAMIQEDEDRRTALGESNATSSFRGTAPMGGSPDPFAAFGGRAPSGFLPDGSRDPFHSRNLNRKPFTPPDLDGGSGVSSQFRGVMSELARLMETASKAMANVLMEQSKSLQSRASALGEAAFSPLRGDLDVSYGRGRSVNPLTGGASRQISEMMKQSSLLEKQATKLDASNTLLKSIEEAIKGQRLGYN